MPHITNCITCGKLYEGFSEETANMPTRECAACWERRENGNPQPSATEGVKASYVAKITKHSSCKIDDAYIPVPINQMIVWSLIHPSKAMDLISDFHRIRKMHADHDAAEFAECERQISTGGF